MNTRAALSPLYVISDRQALPSANSLVEACTRAFAGGARLLQVREKDLDGRTRCHLVQAVVQAGKLYGAKVLVNRDLAAALEGGAAGLHIGAAEIPDIPAIRLAFSDPCLIGVSAHSLDEVHQAAEYGADLVTLGPAYFTPSKAGMGAPLGPALILRAQREYDLPVYALGGIDLARLDEMRAAGQQRFAMIRAIFAAQDPQQATAELLAHLSA